MPLDSDRAVGVGVTTREAMVIINRSSEPIVIERMTIGAEEGEWRLVAPPRPT